MISFLRRTVLALGIWSILLALHAPLLRLPYFWDEAGYYVPAALDFFRHGLLIPVSTLPTGHTPLVMVYLGLLWHLVGYSALVTRSAMILAAAATVAVTVTLASKVFQTCASPRAGAEPVIWSAVLLALAPLFFAQSSMVILDLAVALFTIIGVISLLEESWIAFAVAGSLAVLAKETAIVLVAVAWMFVWLEARRARHSVRPHVWLILASPCVPLALWAFYYHHHTGFWTGNAGYLQYNLYSTLSPIRILLCLMRRVHEVFIAEFSWIVTAAALLGYGWSRKQRLEKGSNTGAKSEAVRRFLLLTALLTGAYLLLLSVVGGAILPRYTLPVYPPLIVLAGLYIWRLPRTWARVCCVMAAAGLVTGWFSNPPYPVPFEDNLAYADFVRLHEQAAEFLSALDAPEGSGSRILTAWPATNELTTPDLGYVASPLRVVPVEGFTPADLAAVRPGSFDVVYLYSRKWEPAGNWLTRFTWIEKLEARYFDYAPQASAEEIERRLNLRLIARWERRGQWAAIYGLDESN